MRVCSVSGRPAFSPRLFAVLAVVALCPACSSDRKPVHKVRGQVLVNGRPAARVQVLLHPAASAVEAPRPAGQTDEQGYFQLTSYVNGDGAPEGDYAVTATWFRVYGNGRAHGGDVVRYNALPQRYAAAQTSLLRVTVNKGDNELTPFQLSSR